MDKTYYIFIDSNYFVEKPNKSKQDKLDSYKIKYKALQSLRSILNTNKVKYKFLTTKIIFQEVNEVFKKEKKFCKEQIEALKQRYSIQSLNEILLKEQCELFEGFEYINCYNDADLIFNDYFNKKKLFEDGKKKNQFPDAFNFYALKNFYKENIKKDNKKKLLLLSKDRDFSINNAEEEIFYEMFENNEQLLDYLQLKLSKNSEEYKTLKEELIDSINSFFPCDKIYEDISYDEPSFENSCYIEEYLNLEAKLQSLDIYKDSHKIYLYFSLDFHESEGSYLDEDNSIWADGEWFYRRLGYFGYDVATSKTFELTLNSNSINYEDFKNLMISYLEKVFYTRTEEWDY